jgi:hypothetical protein
LAGLRRDSLGSMFLVLITQPPGTIAPSTMNKGTTNSGSTILISNIIEVQNTIDMALSIAPLLSNGAKLWWKISLNSVR